jgi:hypothetical protein
MRRPPPRRPVGSPKTPGSGRKKGSLNKKTVELRGLMAALTGDARYQQKLREDFTKRRVHPSTEALVWAYAIGKPKDQIELSAKASMDDRLAADCDLFAKLDIDDLRELAAESEALIGKARALAQRQRVRPAEGPLSPA